MSWVVLLLLAQAPSAEDLGRELTVSLQKQDTAALWARFGPAARRQFKSEQGLKAFARKVAGDFGEEQRLTSEKVSERGKAVMYSRLAVYSRYALGVEVEWLLDGDGLVAGLSVQPAFREAPSLYTEYHPKTDLQFPLQGTWFVLWGGRTWDVNRHASVPDMRFAYDLLIYKGASTCAAPCTGNEHYYAWGKAVHAPGDGVVVAVENQVVDNPPNQPSTRTLFGNYVVIDHLNGEFSLLGHLQKGSVKVRRGETVEAGALVGKVGSGGVSTEPHLHYQLMDAADYRQAHGLPIEFVNYVSDGKRVARGEPRRGQLIGPGDR